MQTLDLPLVLGAEDLLLAFSHILRGSIELNQLLYRPNNIAPIDLRNALYLDPPEPVRNIRWPSETYHRDLIIHKDIYYLASPFPFRKTGS